MEESIKGILEAIEYYIDGARKSDRSIVAKAFADDATMSWSENGELRIVPIEVLYDYGDSLGPQEVAYSLTECSATEDTAIVRIESDFSKAGKFTEHGRTLGATCRDGDKLKVAGLTPEFTELGNPIFKEANLAIECKIIYSAPFDIDKMSPEARKIYDQGMGVHTMYIGEIVNVWCK